MKQGTEEWVKDGIAKWLRAMGAWYYMPVQMGLGAGGIHDFITCIPVKIKPGMVGMTIGAFVSIEAKETGIIATLIRQAQAGGKHAHWAEDGKFISNRSLQAYQADNIHAAKGEAWICDDPGQLYELERDWRVRRGDNLFENKI